MSIHVGAACELSPVLCRHTNTVAVSHYTVYASECVGADHACCARGCVRVCAMLCMQKSSSQRAAVMCLID